MNQENLKVSDSLKTENEALVKKNKQLEENFNSSFGLLNDLTCSQSFIRMHSPEEVNVTNEIIP